MSDYTTGVLGTVPAEERRGRFHRINGAFRSLIPLLAIMALNFVFFGIQMATGGADGFFTRDGGLVEQAVDNGQWWRMVSSGFLHENWAHLTGNMVTLAVLGLWLTKRIGAERMVWAYVVGLFAASWGSMLFQSNVMAIGASGAIFGLAGTLFAIGIRQRSPIAIIMVGLWIVYSIYMTAVMPGIAWGAHLGGLIGGLGIGAVMVADKERVVRSITGTRVVGTIAIIACFLGALQLA